MSGRGEDRALVPIALDGCFVRNVVRQAKRGGAAGEVYSKAREGRRGSRSVVKLNGANSKH